MTAQIEVTAQQTQEDLMGRKFEKTFIVAVPVERAWQAFIDPRQRETWMSPPGRDPVEHPEAAYPADGFPPVEFRIGEVQEHKRLSWSQGHTMPSGSKGWVETSVTFEEVDGGTRLSITASGFGEGEEWELFFQSRSQGLEDSLIDLVAYLETGVNVSRHFSGRSSIGASMLEGSRGLEIVKVIPGGYAEEAGLQEGDLLIAVGGAGIYRRSDVGLLQREHGPGEEIEVTYVRDGVLLHGRGRLSEKNYTETHGWIGA